MFRKRLSVQYRFLVGGLLIATLLVSAIATTADARRVRNTAQGAAIGAGVGALVGGGTGARRGAAAGAIIGAIR